MKDLKNMRILAGIDERAMWEKGPTMPDREYVSGAGNKSKSGFIRSAGTGTGDEYEEPEPDDEFETDDDEDINYEPEDDEEDDEEEQDDGEAEDGEDDEEEAPPKKESFGAYDLLAMILEATMSVSDAVKALELPPTWSKDDLKSAFKKAALKHHPDRGGDPKMMVTVNAAYKMLQNVTPSQTKVDREAEQVRKDERKSVIVTSVLSSLFDPKKYAEYFHEMTDKIFTFTVNDKLNVNKYWSGSYRKSVEWKSSDGETIFALEIYVNFSDVHEVKSLGGASDDANLAFKVMLSPTVLHNNRKSKMRKKNWDFSSKQSSLVDPTKVFPKASIKKMMSGADKKRKFSRRDMVTAVEQGMKGSVENAGGHTWARIPVGDYELRLARSVVMRIATWDAISVRAKVDGKWQSFKSKSFAGVKEGEGLVNLLKQVQKHKWSNPQQLIDTVASQMKAMAKSSWNESIAIGGPLPGSEPPAVRLMPKCCDSCPPGKPCKKKKQKEKMEELQERRRRRRRPKARRAKKIYRWRR